MKSFRLFALGIAAGFGLYLVLSILIPALTGLLIPLTGVAFVWYGKHITEERKKAQKNYQTSGQA